MSEIRSFTSLDKFNIEGRGTVFVVENDRDRSGDWGDLYPEVMIDDETYELRGVETYALEHIRKGQTIGLLVKDEVEVTK